ncbi:MAG: hypothetical protein JWN10_1176 [Solirubrobacterales bacterium]|nr:hypothetical protein [Solirubrobacterales bacterium]
MRAARRAARFLALAVSVLIWHAPPATATQSVKLNVSLKPERLGAGTTMSFAFQITSPNSQTPPPLSTVDLLYPANLGLITSGLGVSTCSRTELETTGACPPDALMGYGTAVAEIPFEPETIIETAKITTWMASIEEGHLGLLFLAKAGTPVAAELIFPSLILNAPPPYGGSLATTVPVVATVPGGPDVAVTRLRSTLGPMHLTYYETFHGKTTAYHPKGIRLPHTCPHGGFPFAATFTFLDDTHASAHTTVPCPTHATRPSQ